MPTVKFLVLIVGLPSRLRDGLRAMLSTMPWVSEIKYADSCEEGYEMAAAAGSCIALIDADIFDNDHWHLIEGYRRLCHKVHLFVIARTFDQREAGLAAGADDVLMRGFSTEMLRTALTRPFTAATAVSPSKTS